MVVRGNRLFDMKDLKKERSVPENFDARLSFLLIFHREKEEISSFGSFCF